MSLSEIRELIAAKVSGKIEAAHDEKGHHYRFVESGNIVDSVTTKNCLEKKHLLPWAVKLAIEWLEIDNRFLRLSNNVERESLIKGATLAHRDIRDDAGNIGSIAHKIIEQWIDMWIATGKRPGPITELIPEGTDYRVYGSCRSAEALFDRFPAVPVVSEILVGIDGFGAGTLDLLVLMDGKKLELWDFKTSNNVNDFYAIQVSAYAHMFEKMTGLKISKSRIMKIDKYSDKFKVYLIPHKAKAIKAFKAVSAMYDWLNNGEEKLIEDKVIVKL